jgi:hypothetical protein
MALIMYCRTRIDFIIVKNVVDVKKYIKAGDTDTE